MAPEALGVLLETNLATPSHEYTRFVQSMQIGYMQWHDGIPYDHEALAALTGDERARAEALLLPRAQSDWRDIVALDVLGSEAALGAIEKALGCKQLDVRLHAVDCLEARKRLTPEQVETIIVAALSETSLLNGQTHLLLLAQAHPTEAVRQKLLWCALHGHDDLRVHAAALVHFLYGRAASSFDWAKRPLYLHFGGKRAERLAAYRQLCREIGVAPQWADPRVASQAE